MTSRHQSSQSRTNTAGTRLTRHLLAASLTSLLFVQPALGLTLAAEEPHDAADKLPDAPLPESGGLTIEILDGEGALNNIRQRTAREPIVQVEDKNHKPVAGALVLFTINSGPSGASGSIAGATTFTVRTGPDGKAQLRNFKPNSLSGDFTITVTASLGALTAAAILIHQKNETGAPGEAQNPSASATTPLKAQHRFLIQNSWGKTIAVAGGVIGVGVIVVIIAVTQKTTGTTITAGAGGVGAP
jgi:hypothetical protein